MANKTAKKISLGEKKFIERELEAFAGPGKQRGCPICRNGDQNIASVARDKGYSAKKLADFLIQTRNYDRSVMHQHAVYRHWYRCEKEADPKR